MPSPRLARVFQDKASGAKADRPGLTAVLASTLLSPGWFGIGLLLIVTLEADLVTRLQHRFQQRPLQSRAPAWCWSGGRRAPGDRNQAQ